MVQAHDDRVRASLDIQVSQRNPTAILEDSITSVNTLVRIINWEPERRYQYSKIFHWELEGHYNNS